MSERLTTEEFIKKAVNRYGPLYDYSKSVYIDSHKKVCINCSIHGDFYKTPMAHLSGQGCILCGIRKRSNNKKLTKNKFIEKSNLIHGEGKYDYSKVLYQKTLNKVCIICPVHGEFFQTPGNHMSGQGCPECNKKTYKNITTNMFIDRAKLVHGNNYDYSSVDYKSTENEISIICPTHGIFFQKPKLHILGHGCALCAIKKNQEKLRMTMATFIKRALSVHNPEKYDYSEVFYKDARTKVSIICPIHGKFYQSPHKHLSGQKCPQCNNTSRGEKAVIKWFNKRGIEYKHQYSFPDLKSPMGRLLEFDFCTKYIKFLIEYDGEQHFKPVRFHGMSEEQAYKAFRKNKHHDFLKNQYCVKRNFPLIRIPYKDYKNISKILDSKLLGIGYTESLQ